MRASEGRQALLLFIALLLTGSLAWWLSVRPVLAVDFDGLGELPSTLRGWTAVDVPIDQAVTDMLRADANLQRAYFHPQGYVVFVYVGYYGTKRGGVPEHTPDACYPAQGWEIVRSEQIHFGGRGGITVREFLVQNEGDQRLVHFWYRTQATTGITSTFSLRLHQFWGRITSNRGDGALVRLSTPVNDGDIESARAKLLLMDQAVDLALSGAWPTEVATHGSLRTLQLRQVFLAKASISGTLILTPSSPLGVRGGSSCED